jgi:hypothetical protein
LALCQQSRHLKESRILSHSHLSIDGLRRHPWAVATIGSVSLLGMVAAFAIAPTPDEARVKLTTVLEKLPTPTVTLLEKGDASFLHEERVRRGDTVASLLTRLGINDREALQFIGSNRQTQEMARHLRPGDTLGAKSGEKGKLHALYAELPGKDAMLVVERRGDGFEAHEQALQLSTRVVIKAGEIRHSLFAATDEADIPDAIALQMVAIFSSEVDFHRDLRKGDRFSLVYETFSFPRPEHP